VSDPGKTRGLARPAILGAFDGTASYLGIIVYLASTHPALIVPTALVGAIGSGISMGGGEWLSDSESGFGASLVMAGATFCGALLPALPFALWHGPLAVAESVIVCICIGITVSMLRPKRGLGLALAETFSIMATVLGVVLLLGLVLPGGAA
jgi:VIT1/CCC1 family predicted Fe2+/Mn2+ transporter